MALSLCLVAQLSGLMLRALMASAFPSFACDSFAPKAVIQLVVSGVVNVDDSVFREG